MKSIITAFLIFKILVQGYGQVYFVDVVNGVDANDGTKSNPFKSLSRAIDKANLLTASGDITIKVMPGTYVLEDKIVINPVRIFGDSNRFTVEAYFNPDDEMWSPEKMPVILSVASHNSHTLFDHSVGFLIASERVTINGLKFLGNANQAISYYYPIVKEDTTLADLAVTQCVFIGDKESSFIQGGVWAHGPNNVIDHCVFYECRNAVLFFDNVEGFQITNSIISKSYESAFWWTPKDVDFEFRNNILVHNENVIVSSRAKKPTYSSPLKNSIISDNKSFVGYWSREDSKVMPAEAPVIKLENVVQNIYTEIQENFGTKWDRGHLHVKGNTAKAGIFTK